MKQFFLFLLLSVTTFGIAQEDLSVSVIDFNSQNHLLIWGCTIIARNSTKQISNLQGKVTFRGIPALDGYQVIFEGTAVYAAQKSDLISVRSNQAPMYLGIGSYESNQLNEVVVTKGATAKLIVAMLRFLWNEGSRDSRNSCRRTWHY
jgi:hypothetical protein